VDSNIFGSLPPEYQAEMQKFLRQRQMAELMQKQAMMQRPMEMTGGKYSRVVPMNPLQGLIQGLSAYQGGKGMQEADKGTADAMTRAGTARQEELARILALPPEQRGSQAAASPWGDVQKQAPFFQGQYEKTADRTQAANFKQGDWNRADIRTGLDERRFIADQDYRTRNFERLDKEHAEAVKRGDEKHANDLVKLRQGWRQLEIANKLADTRQYAAENKPGAAGNPRPMPAAALKLQEEDMDILQTALNQEADLTELVSQIETGDLKPGLISNMESSARNYLGASTPESQNYASFSAALEKMRNDSLRLNKGVQTEGDAVRAWNELLAHKNDPEVVKKRLGEIVTLNRKAALAKQEAVNRVRENYQHPAMDFTGMKPVPSITNARSRKSTPEQLPPGVVRVE
jgi:hypothetical protein